MSDISNTERDEIAQAIAQGLTAPAQAADLQAAVNLQDAKKLFCDNWSTVKQVLIFLKTVVPGPISAVIGLVIVAGDSAKGVICR